MPQRRGVVIARLLWILPAILLYLTVNQIGVALDIRQTLDRGEQARAEVIEIFMTNRADVTYGYVRLRIPTNGSTIERQLSMPLSLLNAIEGSDSLDVRLLPDEDVDVVVAELARPQWRMAASNAGMSFIGLILLTVGIYSWNRYLKREGDPADRRESSR